MAFVRSPKSPVHPDLKAAQQLIQDLLRPRATFFWNDLGFTCFVGWVAFFLAIWTDSAVWGTVLAAGASMALYRGLCFMHELTHFQNGSLKGFETAWNWVIGVPLLMPSFMYVGVHQDHHRMATYGTHEDPEYLPFASSSSMTLVFMLHSVLIPLFLLVRFLVLGPIGLIWPRFQRWLAVHASALAMNKSYRRKLSATLLSRMRRWQFAILAVWATVACIAGSNQVLGKTLLVWYAATALAAFVNVLRTLAAHRYESSGQALDRPHQIEDSIDTPGSWWTEIWAPVGLRYHAVHHLFPGIPYHYLPEAYRRLTTTPGISDWYLQMSSPGLVPALHELYQAGHQSTEPRTT